MLPLKSDETKVVSKIGHAKFWQAMECYGNILERNKCCLKCCRKGFEVSWSVTKLLILNCAQKCALGRPEIDRKWPENCAERALKCEMDRGRGF